MFLKIFYKNNLTILSLIIGYVCMNRLDKRGLESIGLEFSNRESSGLFVWIGYVSCVCFLMGLNVWK